MLGEGGWEEKRKSLLLVGVGGRVSLTLPGVGSCSPCAPAYVKRQVSGRISSRTACCGELKNMGKKCVSALGTLRVIKQILVFFFSPDVIYLTLKRDSERGRLREW